MKHENLEETRVFGAVWYDRGLDFFLGLKLPR